MRQRHIARPNKAFGQATCTSKQVYKIQHIRIFLETAKLCAAKLVFFCGKTVILPEIANGK